MYPELFRIPFINTPLYSYGLMMMIGFICATQLAKYLARRTGVDPEFFVNVGLIALVSGVIGARLSHVFENWSYFTSSDRDAWENFLDAVNIRSGGLTYYGGFLLAAPCCIAYALWKKVPTRHAIDILAPALMVGLAFGRIGCFLNGCCYGAECQLPWAVHFPFGSNAYVEEFEANRLIPSPELLRTLPSGKMAFKTPAELRAEMGPTRARQLLAGQQTVGLHPAQLYSTFTAFLIAALLVSLMTLPHTQGSLAMLMMVLEGASRFVLELLRAEPAVAETRWGGLSLSMIISLGLILVGVAGWLVMRKIPARHDVHQLADRDPENHARALATRV